MYVRGKSKHSANTITERIQGCIAKYPPEAPFCTPIMNLKGRQNNNPKQDILLD